MAEIYHHGCYFDEYEYTYKKRPEVGFRAHAAGFVSPLAFMTTNFMTRPHVLSDGTSVIRPQFPVTTGANGTKFTHPSGHHRDRLVCTMHHAESTTVARDIMKDMYAAMVRHVRRAVASNPQARHLLKWSEDGSTYEGKEVDDAPPAWDAKIEGRAVTLADQLLRHQATCQWDTGFASIATALLPATPAARKRKRSEVNASALCLVVAKELRAQLKPLIDCCTATLVQQLEPAFQRTVLAVSIADGQCTDSA
jgi:hypothetical protein